MPILTEIKELVKASIGIDLRTLGSSSSLARGLRERMAICGLTDESGYLYLLQNSPSELRELVEFIVVPETWFFRDEKPFHCLQKFVVDEWHPSPSSAPLNILSIPCSSGEEPYTISMALLDIGLTPEQFRIEAYDVSRCALAKAQRAVYQGNSFRSRDTGFRDRYFQLTMEGYKLDDQVRRSVIFVQGNILAQGFASGKGPYHAVFFRNLMIYFGAAQQEQAMTVVDKLLSSRGILFVGHAESSQAINRGYAPVRFPFGFAYRRRSQAEQRKPPSISTFKQRDAFSADELDQLRTKVSRTVPKPLPKQMSKIDPLALAFEKADKGLTDEARELCEAALNLQPSCADAYYLLGLLLQAQGNDQAEAEKCLLKAVYLEPDHYQALAHLAMAAELRGDTKAAGLFRQRAHSAEKKVG